MFSLFYLRALHNVLSRTKEITFWSRKKIGSATQLTNCNTNNRSISPPNLEYIYQEQDTGKMCSRYNKEGKFVKLSSPDIIQTKGSYRSLVIYKS